jgi:hypothetical protein
MRMNRLRVPVAVAFEGFRAYVLDLTHKHPALKLFPRHEALREPVVICGDHEPHEGHQGRCAVCGGYALTLEEYEAARRAA